MKFTCEIYFDPRDWWVGVYRGPNHLYVCPVPCLVFRFSRAFIPSRGGETP